MSCEDTPVTPVITVSKKRELTSPDFDIDSKKNKCASASSVSDLELDISIDLENSDKSSETMASNVTSSAPPVSSAPSPHIVIPPTELLKISKMLKRNSRDGRLGCCWGFKGAPR